MNIVVISTLSEGGAAIATLAICRALWAAGHNLSLFSLAPSSKVEFINLSDRHSFYNAAAIKKAFTHWASLSSREKLDLGASDLFSNGLSCMPGLSGAAKEHIAKADVVHLHWVAGVYTSPELLDALVGKKVVITLHDMNAFTGGCHYHISCDKYLTRCHDCPCLNISGPGDLSSRTWDLKKEIYRSLRPSVVAPSRWLADLSRKSSLLGDAPTKAIIHCQDLHTFTPLSEKDRKKARRKAHIADSTAVIMAGSEDVGNNRKNLSTLLEALDIVAVRGFDFRLRLFGRGKIDQRAYPISHLGVLSSKELPGQYAMADLFVHPSKLDALTLTLCEAQCCGTPVMSFDAGGTVDAFIPEETGFLVKEMSSAALAEKLTAVLSDRERLATMRAKSVAFARERFDPQKMAAAYEEVFGAAEPALKLDDFDAEGLLAANKEESVKIMKKIKFSFKKRLYLQSHRIAWLRAGWRFMRRTLRA